MIKTPFNLRRVLTTSSTIFLVSLCSYNAFAATKTASGNVSFGNNTNWLPDAPVDNDNILYGGNYSLNANVTDRIISAINLNGNAPSTFTINNSLSIGSIGDSLAGAGGLNLKFGADNQTLNLTGTPGGGIGTNNYTKLTSVDFNGINSILKISRENANIGASLYGNKSGTFGQLGGTIEIDANNVTLSGAFENTMVRRVVNINVNANNTLILDTDLKLYNELQIADGGYLTVRAGKNLSATNLKSDPSSAFAEIATIKFEGDSVVDTFIGQGGNSRMGFIEMKTPNSTVEFKKTVLLNQYFYISPNSEAIFSDGANFSSAGIFQTAPGAGTFTFLGDSEVNSSLTGIDTINISGVGKTGKISTVEIVNNVNLADNATVKFTAGVIATDVRGNVPSTATVEFISDSIATAVDTDLGITGKLRTVKISKKGIIFSGDISTDNIEFTNPTVSSAFKFSGNGQIGGANVTSASITRLHNIWVNSDQEITGSIGTEANPFGTIKFSSDKVIKINTDKFYSDVSTTNSGEGKLEFIKDGSFSYSAGDALAYLSEIRFTENAEIRGSAYANEIKISAGKTGAFKKRTSITDASVINPYVRTTNGTVLEGAGSTAFFGDGIELYNDRADETFNGNIFTNFAGEGKVVFEGSADLKVHIGAPGQRIKEVEFSGSDPSKLVRFSRNIHATDTKFDKSTLSIVIGGVIDGNVMFKDTTIDVGQHILVISDGATKFTGNPILKVYFDNKSNSHITARGASSYIDLSSAQTITFDINDLSTLPPRAGRIYNFFRFENGATLADIDVSKVIIKEINPFVSWAYKDHALLQIKDIVKGLETIVKAAGGKTSNIPDALKGVDTDIDSSASRFINELAAISSIDPERAGEALERVINSTDPAHEVVVTNVNNVQSVIFTTRIENIEQFKFRLVEVSGVAAGDDLKNRFGAWVNPFYNQTVQKKNGNIVGYRSRATGGSLGFDTMVNDNLTLGIAGTALNTKVNYKYPKDGDTTKIDSLLFSIYGLQNLSNNWFMEAIGSIGTNKVKNSKVRFIVNGEQHALSKYTSRSYGLEFKAGYNHNLTNTAVLTPSAGLRYNHFSGDRYQEIGTTNQNLSMSKKKFDKLEGIVGLQLSAMFELKKLTLIPQIHSSVNYNFSQKTPSTDINLDGLDRPMPSRSVKASPTLFNVGAGVKAQVKRMEYELSYDAHLAMKYVSHQGSFKIRVNF